jgi:hypothetical protein
MAKVAAVSNEIVLRLARTFGVEPDELPVTWWMFAEEQGREEQREEIKRAASE